MFAEVDFSFDETTDTFTIRRTFEVSRDLMFRVWTEVDHMARWWGPKGFTVKHAEMGLRPGGLFHYCLAGPDSLELWGKFVFREVTKPEKLVFLSSFSDPDGGLTVHPLSPTWPCELLTTVTFAERDGKTTVTVQWTPHHASAAEIKTFRDGRTSMMQGWTGTFEQLHGYLVEVATRT